MDLGLKGKAAIVTGGAGGIGSSIARVLASEGANVAIVDIDRENADQLVEELKGAGVDALAVIADCSKVKYINEAVEQIVKYFGRVDILVNNLGGGSDKNGMRVLEIDKVDEEEYDHRLGYNLKSTFFFTKAVIPRMKAQHYGKIVNMASMAGQVGIEYTSAQYSAAKAGVVGLTRNLARFLGPYGIYINAVAPGSVKTPRIAAYWKDQGEEDEAFLKTIPLRRRSDPVEQARVVVFLCSDASSYVTGTTISVDGGCWA